MRKILFLPLFVTLCGFTDIDLKMTTSPDTDIRDEKTGCLVKYQYYSNPKKNKKATEVYLRCGSTGGIIWRASGIGHRLKLEWKENSRLRVTHPKGLDILHQMGGKKDWGGKNLEIEFDPPFEETDPEPPLDETNWPTDCDVAAQMIYSSLDGESKTTVAKTSKSDLIMYHHGWGTGIRNHLGLWRGNDKLMKSCMKKEPDSQNHPDTVSMIIIELVWQLVKKNKS